MTALEAFFRLRIVKLSVFSFLALVEEVAFAKLVFDVVVVDGGVMMLEAAEEALEVDGVEAGLVDGDSVCMATLHITGRDFTNETYETVEAGAACATFTRFLASP